MTTLYFIRHGESVGNVEKYFQGQLDIPLSPLGIKQAELTAEYFKNIELDMIFSSDLKRTLFTAEKIGKSKGITVIPDKSFREINAGSWQGVKFSELAENDTAYSVWLNDIGNAKCPNGESVLQLYERINTRTQQIVCENKGKNIAIVSHGGPIRTMCCHWEGVPVSQMHKIGWVSNSSITIADYDDNGGYKIRERGFNKHLGSLITEFGKNV